MDTFLLNESELIACPNPKCKREIIEPIVITDSSTSPLRRYYGCPHCFIEINSVFIIGQKKELLNKRTENEEKTSLLCNHQFGYLASRPKDIPIPQQCLVCLKLLECMLT